MTVLEFEAWVSDNYESLVGAARRAAHGEEAAVDLLHDVVEDVCAGRRSLPPQGDRDTIAWFARAIKWTRLNQFASDQAAGRAVDKFRHNVEALGLADASLDNTPAQNRRKKRTYNLKQGAGTAESVADLERQAAASFKTLQDGLQAARDQEEQMVPSALKWRLSSAHSRGIAENLQWDGPLEGSVRWHWQQRRDDSLFHERAVRSLAESLRRAARGLVPQMRPAEPGPNGRPWPFPQWTHISSSTGTRNDKGRSALPAAVVTTGPAFPVIPVGNEDLAAIWKWGAYQFWRSEDEEFGSRSFA